MGLKQYDLALETYNKAVEVAPNNAEVYVSRGAFYAHLNKYELAVKDFSKAIEIDPNNAWVYDLRANSYYHLGKCQLAIDDYKKEAELKNDYRGLEDRIERCRQKMNAQG